MKIGKEKSFEKKKSYPWMNGIWKWKKKARDPGYVSTNLLFS